MDDGIRAHGLPYDPDMFRWLTCHQGSRWCGWHRSPNSVDAWRVAVRERVEHEETCHGG